MGRGFLSGLFWGGIAGVALLAASTFVLDRQQLSLPQPQAGTVEVPGGSEFDQARPETEPVLPGAEDRPEAGDVAGVAIPSDEVDAPPALDSTALQVPVPETTQEAPDALGDAPVEVAETDDIARDTDDAVNAAVAEALETPDNPGDAPDAASEAPVANAAAADDDTAPDLAQSEDTTLGTQDVAALPDADASDAQPNTDGTTATVTGQDEAPAALTAPETGEAPTGLAGLTSGDAQVSEAPDAPALPQITSERSLPPAGTVPAQTPGVQVDRRSLLNRNPADIDEADLDELEDLQNEAEASRQLVQIEGAREETGAKTVKPVTRSAESSLPVVRRLGNSQTERAADGEETAETEVEDTVAEETPPAAEDPVADADVVADEDTVTSDENVATEEIVTLDETAQPTGRALQVFGSSFQNADGLPLLAIVLIHDPATAISNDVLNSLPENVAFAVDASASDVRDTADFYRQNGREVVMIPSLPMGAAPQDVEQALGVNFSRVPEAVAVMDVSGSSFQSDRAAVAQVVDVVADTGHGLITFPRGLNTAHQEAQRAGVPTGLISRNLDTSGDDIERIRRSMDRAAFRARQDEAVILVGTASPSMLAAIVEWFSGNRAASIALAPVSAALDGS